MAPLISRLGSAGITNIKSNGSNKRKRRGGGAPNFLFAFTSHTFTPGTSAGSRVGPTLSALQNAYAGTTWISGYFSQGSYQGYQRWTVPATGTYTIDAGGGAGGDGTAVYNSSLNTAAALTYGARIQGTFSLTEGDVLEMVIGSKGGSSGGPHGNENGGGGGTFIKNHTTNTLLLVAGGAGGVPSRTYGTNCTRTVSVGHGQAGNAPGSVPTCYSAVSIRSGGYGGYTAGTYMGGAGGGYSGNGANGGTHCATATGGKGYNANATGGTGNSCYNSNNNGGFGGGGGGQLSGPGGGGGYNGGSTAGRWSSWSTYGGGGGSYNAGTNQTNTTGGNTGNTGGYTGAGYCTITFVS